MKTPIQELIRKIELMQYADCVINPLGIINGMAEQLIEKEKQMIIDAYNAGIAEAFNANYIETNSEQYYNETFKQ